MLRQWKSDKFFIHVPLDLLYSVPHASSKALSRYLYRVLPRLPEHLSSSPPVVPLVLLEISSAVPLKHIPFLNCSAYLIFLERFLRVLPLFLTVSPECFSDTPRVFLLIPPDCSWFSYSVPLSSPRVFFLFSSSVPHSSPQSQSALLVLLWSISLSSARKLS